MQKEKQKNFIKIPTSNVLKVEEMGEDIEISINDPFFKDLIDAQEMHKKKQKEKFKRGYFDRMSNRYNHPKMQPLNELNAIRKKQQIELIDRSKKLFHMTKWHHIKQFKQEIQEK